MTKLPVKLHLLFTCLCIYFQYSANAQNNLSDSSFYQSALYNTLSYYHQTLGDQSPIFSGRQYIPYIFSFREGDPYFETRQFRDGTVVYDGILYEKVPLLYDELSGILIVLG